MLKSILNFIGGKDTDIFNKKGRVEHQFADNKWQAWKDRLAKNPNYDWRLHTGKVPDDAPIKNKDKSSN